MKNGFFFFAVILTTLITFTAPQSAHADEFNKRSTSINFEDDVIEGINRKPLDSVSQISENNKHKKPHLYKKRASFADRDQELVKSLALRGQSHEN